MFNFRGIFRLSVIIAVALSAFRMAGPGAAPAKTLAAEALPPADSQPATATPRGKPSRAAAQAAREAKFKTMLTNVVFRGSWQMTNAEGLQGKAPLSPPRSERYTIKGVSKGLGDNWVITARVEFADRDVELPFNVRVLWAGDTPVITLQEQALPMLGTYSARVLVHDGFYAGTWSGPNYGGILSGQIIKAEDEAMIEAKAGEAEQIKLPPKPTSQPAR